MYLPADQQIIAHIGGTITSSGKQPVVQEKVNQLKPSSHKVRLISQKLSQVIDFILMSSNFSNILALPELGKHVLLFGI